MAEADAVVEEEVDDLEVWMGKLVLGTEDGGQIPEDGGQRSVVGGLWAVVELKRAVFENINYPGSS